MQRSRLKQLVDRCRQVSQQAKVRRRSAVMVRVTPDERELLRQVAHARWTSSASVLREGLLKIAAEVVAQKETPA